MMGAQAVAAHAYWILVVTGLLTIAPIGVTVLPGLGLRAAFGQVNPDVFTRTLARHWGLLVALIGGLLVCAAFVPGLREAVMVAAIVEKLAGGLMFSIALPRRPTLMFIVGADAVMALLYILILAGSHARMPA